MKRKSSRPPRIALALSGGGPLGAIYEIGALCALEESLNGIDFTKLQHYVGVSAGGFIAAGLANGITPRALCASFIENDDEPSETFDPSWLLSPAYGEFARRGIMLPSLLISALWHLTAGRKSFIHALEQLAPGLPTGVFSNEQIHVQMARLFSREGRTNDFRQLKTQLTLVATNLDSGEAAPFGRPGWDHVPISKAVQASSALPGLFPPVEIDDSYYVDGALKKTMHASVALDEGMDLMLCLNPLVPFDATAPHVAKVMRRGLPAEKQHIPRIVDGGLPAVLSQTFRSMIHSRMVLGMKQYERSYPNTDIILIEPDHRDPELYLANTFSYAQRRHLAEHAYQQTRQMLRSRKTGLSATLWRHGITLHHEALDDPKRHLTAPAKAPTQIGRAIANLQEIMDDLGHVVRSAAHKETPSW
ncbi:patatin-like phospholipase family protein [Rhodoferax sp.]|uniref:patatin-like phospholipase family protein n=1 Tax=Rhodoferax sp. TaxID=50421 RepID=UPI00271AEFC1|nr:patatin-like phospholipase family protein [Rhodoferax sp.]MDO9197012.1 patatin-like phospholipase family protein [Rhodoferax sp.]